MPLEVKAILKTVETRALREDIAGLSDMVRGWIAILVDSYSLTVAAGRMYHATMGQQNLEIELGDAAAAREAEKILLWAKEECEETLKRAGEWEP